MIAGNRQGGIQHSFHIAGNADQRRFTGTTLKAVCSSKGESTQSNGNNAAESLSIAIRSQQTGQEGDRYDLEKTQVPLELSDVQHLKKTSPSYLQL